MTADAQTPRTCPNCGAFPVEEGKLERELAAAKEGIAALMITHGMATGHGDTCDDLLRLLDAELSAVQGQLEETQRHCDRLTGMKFSDRMHSALVDRAERAESALAAAIEERDTTATDLRDELDAAKAEVEKERKRAGLWVKAARDLARELGLADEYSKASHRDWDLIVKKAREAEALREDAERYRWLKEKYSLPNWSWQELTWHFHLKEPMADNNDLDTAIDAARTGGE